MSTEPLVIQRDGYIESWTINRPADRNPITDEDVVDAFCDATDRANRDRSLRAVIITGAGDAFSAGGNIKAMARREGLFGGAPYEQESGYRHGIQRLTLGITSCEVPTIAAINGAAIGAGCDLALMCDLRVASTSAFFAESFVKLGLIPGDGGAWLLPRVVGGARAAEMLLTGDRVDAHTALSWGMVSAVVDPHKLMEAASTLANRVAANPPIATRMAKRLLSAGQTQRLADVLDLSAALQSVAHTTHDHGEAVAALLERRSGDFRGC